MKPYYQDESATIYHGDSRQILPELEPVDVVITDPPYFGYKVDEAEAEVHAEYSANAAVALHIASQMAPAMVVLTKYNDSIKRIIRDLPFSWGGAWDCDEEWVAVYGFGRKRPVPLWGKGGPRLPIPVEVTRRLYEPFAPGTLLDPFMGSPSTLQAARSLGGKAIGIEISEERCEQAATAFSVG